METEGSQRGADWAVVYQPLSPEGREISDHNIFDVRTSEGRVAAAQKVRRLRRDDPNEPIMMDYTLKMGRGL